MAIRFDNGYKEFYLPEDVNDVLEGYSVGDKIIIKAVPIKEFLYKNESGYGLYLCEEVLPDDSRDIPGTFLFSGTFINPIDIGQTYEVSGSVSEYNGRNQVKVQDIRKILPTNKRGIISFIKSLNGVGIYPELIYDKFGDNSLNIIRDTPKKLLDEFPTLWEEKVLDWQQQLNEIRDDHYIMAKLMGYGLKPTQIKLLFEKFGGSILQKIENNPYFLSAEVRNYSFKKCDEIAQNMGLSPSNQNRINEGVYYCVNMAQYNGDTYILKDVLMEQARDVLALKIGIREAKRLRKEMGDASKTVYKYGNMSFVVSKIELDASIEKYQEARTKAEKEEMKICVFAPKNEQLNSAIDFLNYSNRIFVENDKVFDFYLYKKEQNIAYNLQRLISNFVPVKSNLSEYLDAYCKNKGINLETRQKEAILGICSGKGGVFILNGSAGCGKTFCLGIAIKMLEKLYQKSTGYLDSTIVAPTGKAAQVAAKATGMEASTVHRLLKYKPDTGYQYNASNKLYYDLLVVDESSMLDVELASALLSALDDSTKIVFVGDTKQLPSVGAGNVLKDMIFSEKIPVTTLNVVKRQGKDSGIIKNANRIIDGDVPLTEEETNDAFVYKTDSSIKCVNSILKIVKNRVSEGVNISDIQVLAPMKNGLVGTNYLNYLLQSEINPGNNELSFYKRSIIVPEQGEIHLFFKKGDKVIHTKNNYNAQWYGIVNKKLVKLEDTGIANGECGTIIKLVEREDEYKNKIKTIYVKYDNKIIRYDDDFSELELAYALTIHKSQGSQWDTAIIPIMNSNYMMLDREILYTGYTRAQKQSYIICEDTAMRNALKKVKSEERCTGLKDMIIGYNN